MHQFLQHHCRPSDRRVKRNGEAGTRTGRKEHQAVRQLKAEQLGGELGGRPDDDGVVVADRLGEVAVAVDVDVEPVAQKADSGLRDRLTDEDARARHTVARAS